MVTFIQTTHPIARTLLPAAHIAGLYFPDHILQNI